MSLCVSVIMYIHIYVYICIIYIALLYLSGWQQATPIHDATLAIIVLLGDKFLPSQVSGKGVFVSFQFARDLGAMTMLSFFS